MDDLLATIKERLNLAFSPIGLEVIDEGALHVGHVAHEAGARHVAVKIAAPCFNGLPRVAAHQKIYALFSDLMPHPLHALRIHIKRDDRP